MFTSSTVDHPVDRTGLQALETRIGKDNALASCLLEEGELTVFADQGKQEADRTVVIQQAVDSDWVEVGRYDFWTDAYRALGHSSTRYLTKFPSTRSTALLRRF